MVSPQLRQRFQKLDSSTEQFWRDLSDIKDEAIAVANADSCGSSVLASRELQEFAGPSDGSQVAQELDSAVHCRRSFSAEAVAEDFDDLPSSNGCRSPSTLRSPGSFSAAAEAAELNAQHSSMRLTDQIAELRRGLAKAKSFQSSAMLSTPEASDDGLQEVMPSESISPVRSCIDEDLHRLPEVCDAQVAEIAALRKELESISLSIMEVREQLGTSAESCKRAKSRLLSRIARFEDWYASVMTAEEQIPSRWRIPFPDSEVVDQPQQSWRLPDEHSWDWHALDSELRRKLDLARRKVAQDNEVLCSLQEHHAAGRQRQKELGHQLQERELLAHELGQSASSHFAQRQTIAYTEERAMEDQHRLQNLEAVCLRGRGALSAEDRGRSLLLEDMQERHSCLESELRAADSERGSLWESMERLRCQLGDLQTSALKGPSEPVLMELAQRDEAGWSLNSRLVDMWAEEASVVRFAESEHAAEVSLQQEVAAERSALLSLEMCEAELALEESRLPLSPGDRADWDSGSALEDMRHAFANEIRTISAELNEEPQLEQQRVTHSSLLGNLQAVQETLYTQSVEWQREITSTSATPTVVSGLERALRAWDNVLGTPPASPPRSPPRRLEPLSMHLASPTSSLAPALQSLRSPPSNEALPIGDGPFPLQSPDYPLSAHEEGLRPSGYYPLSPTSTRDAFTAAGSAGDLAAADRWSFAGRSTAASASPSPPWPQSSEGWGLGIAVPLSPSGGSEVVKSTAVASALDALDALLAGKSSSSSPGVAGAVQRQHDDPGELRRP